MNHCVPDFKMDEDYPIPSSSGTPSSTRSKKSTMGDEDIMELLWHNGQVVMQSQSQRQPKRSSPLEQQQQQHHHHQQPSIQQQQQQLFMQEDEMSSWLHYPLEDDSSSFDHSFCADLLYPPPTLSTTSTSTTTVSATVATTTVPVRTTHVTISEPKPPAKSSTTASASTSSMPPPFKRPDSEPTVQNFAMFSIHKARGPAPPPPPGRGRGPGPSSSMALANTVVDSSDTPSIEAIPKIRSTQGSMNILSGALAAGASSAGGQRPVCEMTATSSSPGGSSASGEPITAQKEAPVEDRKRKGREVEEADCQSEDVEFESIETKKQARGSTSTKRSRAAEVHNLSERRRRDRINEKMKALQELIPRCNKSDKASMLDEAIEYLKSLQLQVQMMSMGYGMVPMMYPGVQQYMPPMGMGMGMGMNLEMGMNRPMMPFPNVLASSAYQTAAAPGQLGPRYPMPPFHLPPAPAQDPSRIQASQPDPMLNPAGAPTPIPPRFPLYPDPYQQYHGLPQMQLPLPLPQSQTMTLPSTSKPGPSGGAENVDNPKSG